MPLKYFSARQLRLGVTARPWARRQFFKHAFIIDTPRQNAHVFIRTSKARLPIGLLWGPAIPKEMMKEKTVNAFNHTTEGIAKRAVHELHRISFGRADNQRGPPKGRLDRSTFGAWARDRIGSTVLRIGCRLSSGSEGFPPLALRSSGIQHRAEHCTLCTSSLRCAFPKSFVPLRIHFTRPLHEAADHFRPGRFRIQLRALSVEPAEKVWLDPDTDKRGADTRTAARFFVNRYCFAGRWKLRPALTVDRSIEEIDHGFGYA